MAKYLFERPNFTDIASAKDYLWRLVEALEHLPDEKSTTTNNITNITNNNVDLTDEIVEVGTSNGWAYRKWKSGLAEVWGTVNVTIGTLSQWGQNGLNATDDSYYLTYPSIFTTVPSVQATVEKDSNSVLLATVEKGTASVSPKYKLIGLSNQTLTDQTATIHFYCVGRWK